MPMKNLILPIALLLPGMAHAVICKIVDPQGGITYTDVPLEECPQEVSLPDYSRYAPRPIQVPGARRAEPPPPGAAAQFTRYDAMRVLQPANDAVVRSNEGRVAVSIALEPALQPEHTIAVVLDGKVVTSSFDGGAITLNGIERGTHSLRARVVDPGGRILIESPSVSFTLHKIGLNDTADQSAPRTLPRYSPLQGQPGFGGSGTADFSATGSKDDAPKTPASITSTPGQTNPAFKPNYTP